MQKQPASRRGDRPGPFIVVKKTNSPDPCRRQSKVWTVGHIGMDAGYIRYFSQVWTHVARLLTYSTRTIQSIDSKREAERERARQYQTDWEPVRANKTPAWSPAAH